MWKPMNELTPEHKKAIVDGDVKLLLLSKLGGVHIPVPSKVGIYMDNISFKLGWWDEELKQTCYDTDFTAYILLFNESKFTRLETEQNLLITQLAEIQEKLHRMNAAAHLSGVIVYEG
jgi:hypothetical protein